MAVTCPSCGAPARPGVRFCEECGQRLPATCPSCGAPVPSDKKFCGACGAPLGPGPTDDVRPPHPERFSAPSSYTPPHLAERILKDRAALQGERKQVTVLFADVSGFTRLSERLDPEEVHALMNQAFERMLAEIHRYEGTVNQFLGDGLMALFGAPVAHEDHARRAALAARAMQRALADYRQELASRGINHALTQDVAYASILHARRRELHARIGVAIEELYADRLEERAEELAHHFGRGEVWDRAARYGRHAGDRAAALCVDAKAVEFYDRALDALGRVTPSAATGRLGIDIRLAMRAPLWRAGQLDRLMEIFKDAEALATRHGETDRLDAVYSFLVQYYWAKGEQEQAIRYGQRCLETADARQDLGLRVTGHYYSGWAYQSLGRHADALEHFRRIIILLEGPRETERFGLSGLPYCGACALGAECLGELGDPTAAFELLGRGERVATAADHLYSKVPLAIARGLLLLEGKALAEAIEVLEPTVRICREKRFVGQLMLALCPLGQAYALSGRPDEGVRLTREAIELQEKSGAFVNRARMIGMLAEIYLGAGRLDEAEATAREALGFAHRHQERGYEARIWWVLGDVARACGDRELARRHWESAESIAQELGMRPLAARCRESLSRLQGSDG